jgi:hypothetical protein
VSKLQARRIGQGMDRDKEVTHGLSTFRKNCDELLNNLLVYS